MSKKRKTINDYIEIAQSDIIVYLIITIIVFFILLYISFKTDCYIYLFFNLVMILFSIDKIEAYFNLKKIKTYLVKNKLIDNIGKIEFWNEKNYFLTDKYMLIKYKRKVFCFNYSEIEKIKKEIRFSNGTAADSIDEYLHIILKTGEEIEVLTWSTALVTDEFKNLSSYLLNKNPEIKLITKKKKIMRLFNKNKI